MIKEGLFENLLVINMKIFTALLLTNTGDIGNFIVINKKLFAALLAVNIKLFAAI